MRDDVAARLLDAVATDPEQAPDAVIPARGGVVVMTWRIGFLPVRPAKNVNAPAAPSVRFAITSGPPTSRSLT